MIVFVSQFVVRDSPLGCSLGGAVTLFFAWPRICSRGYSVCGSVHGRSDVGFGRPIGGGSSSVISVSTPASSHCHCHRHRHRSGVGVEDIRSRWGCRWRGLLLWSARCMRSKSLWLFALDGSICRVHVDTGIHRLVRSCVCVMSGVSVWVDIHLLFCYE